jgi:inorganic triphosphatase YgiF
MEIEAKWTLTAPVTPEQIEALRWTPYRIAQPQTLAQHDTFFDTHDRALSRTKHAVRVRHANADLLVTLKGPGTVEAGVHSRPEWELPTASERPEQWPELIRTKLHDLIGEQAVAPLFTVHNDRRTWVLLRDDAVLGEVALDTGMIESGGQQLPLHELEIELKGGERSDLQALAGLIQQQLPAQPEDRSKFARGFALLST